MARPTVRVLALLELLQSRGLVAADELARRLEVDTRTVRRYATALRELDIPVESVRGRYGGYRLAPSYRLPPLMLTDDEAVAVAVALATGGPPDADRALLKLHRLLPPALRARVATLAGATSVTAVGPVALPPDPEIALTLWDAVQAGRRVRIDHTRGGRRPGPPTTRDVDPYGLVVHARRWYLVGHDHLRDAVRIYRADRITAVALLPHSVAVPAGFDPAAHVLRSLTLDAWTHRTVVWLDTDVATARQRLPLTIGDLTTDPTGGSVLTSGVEDLSGMARLLCGLPWPFVVREPAALTEALTAHVADLTKLVHASVGTAP
jgi:predicted DNA-binding transcriptional regulator YafY